MGLKGISYCHHLPEAGAPSVALRGAKAKSPLVMIAALGDVELLDVTFSRNAINQAMFA
jgi:hypothetical protein